MQKLDSVHHFVHIGYDKESFPDFTEALKNHIDEISKKTNSILNFVDEALYSEKEVEKVKIIYLAKILVYFINTYKNQGIDPSYIFRKNIGEILKQLFPIEILDKLYSLLDGTWQKLNQPIISLEQFKKYYPIFPTSSILEKDLPKHILIDMKKHEQIYKNFMRNNFFNVLLLLVKEFENTNIFNIPTSDSFENDEVNNKKRKQEIKEYAIKKLGENRVITSGMKDGEFSRVQSANEMKTGKMNKEINLDLDFDLTFDRDIWKQKFGNALDYIILVNNELSFMREERLKKGFFDAIKSKGFELTLDTQHIVGGEYYRYCVESFAGLLEIFGIPKNQIYTYNKISL